MIDSKQKDFVSTMVTLSPPAIQDKDRVVFEFEPELTSRSLFEIKRSNRHIKASETLRCDPLLVVPEQQLVSVSGMAGESCEFDIFPASFKLRRNAKKEIAEALK